jgi:DNA helicase-2/ATP-dependent DNA helicase PcrA
LEAVSKIMDQRQDESESLRIHLQKNLMFYTGLKEADLMDDSRKIVVATIHKSKGLAFDSVYMPALVNYQFPHYFDQTPEQVLEAKRLFYVAMSRAKKNIYLSFHTARQMRNGQTMKVNVSPFLNDIKSFFTEECL